MFAKRRKWTRLLLAAIAGSACSALVAAAAGADEATGGGKADILSLQRRLTDAGCFKGALDGASSAALDEAEKACPDQRPTLRIETGMHTAPIKTIGSDANCTVAVTSSDDKTIKIWSLPDGRLERTIRLPIGAGDSGKVFAATLSPDGRSLAAGGWDASYEKTGTDSLNLVDLRTGAIRRIGSFDNVVDAIAFSPDGRRVAVGLGGQAGLRVYDGASGAELFADHDYRDQILGLAFAPDGALIVASIDGAVRRYAQDFRRTANRVIAAGKSPFRVAIDPAGRRVAIGFSDAPLVAILDAVSLASIANVDAKDIQKYDIGAVAWSGDGATLAAGGGASVWTDGRWRYFVRRFTAAGRRLGADAFVSSDTIQDLRGCGAGFLFAAQDPAFGWLGSDGKATALQGRRTADMRGKKGEAFSVSGDTAIVRFGLEENGVQPVQFDLFAASLTESPTRSPGLTPPSLTGLPVTDWENSDAPKFRGAPIKLADHEKSRAAAVRPDHKGFALGADWSLRAFDASGKERWSQPGPGAAWGVNFSADGDLVTVAYGDGTIRWLRWSDGQELLALFVDAPTRKWVAWTPTGYYMASAGAEDLIGWHVNRGWAQQADFFPASRFSQRFNRPDVVQLVLKTRDEAEAVRQANGASNRRVELTPIVAQLPPVTAIVPPALGGKFSGSTIDVTFTVRSPSGLPIDGVQALVDGRPVDVRGLAPTPDPPASGAGVETRHLTIPVPPRDFELSLIARSGQLVGEAARTRYVWAGAAPSDSAPKPKLYLVTIGVSDYVDPNLKLGFAAADARGFADALQGQAGGMYSEVKALPPLVDRQVTRASVISALRWLRKQVTERDIGMVLVAGHGTTDDGQNYWFLPSDANRDNLDAAGVSQDDLLRELRQVAGKTVLFLDTCHANQAAAGGVVRRGATDIDGVINEFTKTENGLVVFSSSRGRETSQEAPAWGHGAFTKALIEGIGEGKADIRHEGKITVSELDFYVAERVKDLTSGDQHPVMTRPPTMQDFPFAVSR